MSSNKSVLIYLKNCSDATSFKNKLKQFKLNNNAIELVYELDTPIIEVVDNCFDLNLKAFKDKIYIYSSNSIQGELSFDISNNLNTQTKENTNSINTSLNAINIVNDRASRLEEAQLSTALNIIEIKKNTSMLNNGEINEYSNHTGTFIECNNTLDSRTENMIIKGRTLVNLIPLIDENTKHKLSQAGQGLGIVKEIIKKGTYKWRRSSEGNGSYYPRIEIENNLKQGTTYTIQFCIETNIPNTNKGFNISYGDAYVGKMGNTTLINIGNSTEENLSYCKYTFTTFTTVTNKVNNILYLGFAPIGDDINGWIQISDIILLEGD